MRRLRVPVAVLTLCLPLLFGSGSARSQDASPEALAAAHELVTTAHLADAFQKIFPLMLQQMMQQLKPAIVQGRPDVERQFDATVPKMMEAFQGRIDSFVDGTTQIYAKHFTVDELRQLTAFYRTPAGQKYITLLPALSQEAMLMGRSIGAEIGKELQDRMIEEMKKGGDKP
jgi:uncharacterized protein